jgi:carbon storage regulator
MFLSRFVKGNVLQLNKQKFNATTLPFPMHKGGARILIYQFYQKLEKDMLVLTRKPGEGIVIGDNVIVKIIEVKGGGIRIGIDAPRETKIYRQEVYDRIRQENIDAANWDVDDIDTLGANLTVRTREK